MKEIPLTKGKVAIVDDEDFEWLSRHKWCLRADRYAGRKVRGGWEYMHRAVLGAKRGEIVDHKNHDRLDNRRSNLRLCSKRENALNVPPRPNRLKGVTYPADAARAYDAAAREHYGEFACLNFSQEAA